MAITRKEVESSNIRSYGWEGSTLEVEFKNGGVWMYKEVPEDVLKGLDDADSKGSYFYHNIRGKYNDTQIA